MATLGGEGEGEPLDGDLNGSSGEGGEEYKASTTDGNEEEPAVVAAPFPGSELRESLGFLKAVKKLALPGVGFSEGPDDGRVVALAALDRFGFLLVSSATGERRESPPRTHPGISESKRRCAHPHASGFISPLPP